MLLKNNKGFGLFDTILSFSLFVLLSLSMLPVFQTVQQEQSILDIRSQMISVIYNELFEVIHIADQPPVITRQVTIEKTDAIIEILLKEIGWQGCISWTNIKSQRERKCFYVTKNNTK